ncbi:MAG TPA: J domain-containing protein [bacterium]|nr:J domain-containing protein [bacterium]
MKDYYIVLGVPRDCSQDAIKKAYRELALKYHPDRPDSGDVNHFREVQEAYEKIGDAESRNRYDRELENEQPNLNSFFSKNDPHFSRPTQWNYRGAEWIFKQSDFDLEIILNRQEAQRGIVIPIQLPVNEACPFCDGTGLAMSLFFSCPVCAGTGEIVSANEFYLNIPPLTSPLNQVKLRLENFQKIKLLIRIE